MSVSLKLAGICPQSKAIFWILHLLFWSSRFVQFIAWDESSVCVTHTLPLMCKYRHLCTHNAALFKPCRQLDCLIFMVDFLHISHPHPVSWRPTQAPILASDPTQQPPTLRDGRTTPFWATSLVQTGWLVAEEDRLWFCLVSFLCTHVSMSVLSHCFLIFQQQERTRLSHWCNYRHWCEPWRTEELWKSLLVRDVRPQRLSLVLTASSSLIAGRL